MKIKKSIRDALLTIFYFSHAHVIVNKNPPLTRVLTFHDIPNKRTFEEKIKSIRKYNIIGLESILKGNLSKEKINIAITFDDGFESQYTTAAPVLNKYGLPATFFISSGFIDSKKTDNFCKKNLMVSDKKPMSWSQIKEISKDFEIGGHSINHKNLAKLDAKELKTEIREDKEKIESQIQKKIRYFAYPFGNYVHITEDVEKAVEQAGYKAAFTIIPGRIIKASNEFLLNRLSVTPDMGKTIFNSFVLGDYELLKKITWEKQDNI